MSPETLAAVIGGVAGGVVGGVLGILGVAVGLFGERWVRRWGDVRCSIDSWHDVTDTGIPNEERVVEVTFLNEKDLNADLVDDAPERLVTLLFKKYREQQKG
jgi:hypothetical protein